MRVCYIFDWIIHLPSRHLLVQCQQNKVNRTMYEICSDLTIETPEWRHWHRFGVFNMNFEHSSHVVLMFPWLTFNKGTPVGLTSSCAPNVWHEDTIKMPWIFLRWKNTRRTTMGMLLASSWLIFWKFGVKF